MDCTKKVVVDIEELTNLYSILNSITKLLPYNRQEKILYKGIATLDSDISLYEKRNLQKLYNYRLKTFRVLDRTFNEKCIFSYNDGAEKKCAVLEFCKDRDIEDCRPRSCRRND